jgi:hypothetical protein
MFRGLVSFQGQARRQFTRPWRGVHEFIAECCGGLVATIAK